MEPFGALSNPQVALTPQNSGSNNYKMVDLFRALSNPEVASRVDAAVAALDRILASGAAQPATERGPLPLGHRVLRREAVAVLRDAGGVLRIGAVHEQIEQRLGRPVSRHTLTWSLASAARDPKLPIVKVRPGYYRHETTS